MPDQFHCPSEVFDLPASGVARLDAAHKIELPDGAQRVAFEMGWISAFKYILTQGEIKGLVAEATEGAIDIDNVRIEMWCDTCKSNTHAQTDGGQSVPYCIVCGNKELNRRGGG